MTYLRWLAIFLCLPLAVLWLTHFRLLWSQRRAIRMCAVWALILSVPWDGWAIRTRIWTFPADTHLGFWIAGLPLEEYLFIVCAAILISSFTLVLGARAERGWAGPRPR